MHPGMSHPNNKAGAATLRHGREAGIQVSGGQNPPQRCPLTLSLAIFHGAPWTVDDLEDRTCPPVCPYVPSSGPDREETLCGGVLME